MLAGHGSLALAAHCWHLVCSSIHRKTASKNYLIQTRLDLNYAHQSGCRIRAWVCQGTAGCQIPVMAENSRISPCPCLTVLHRRLRHPRCPRGRTTSKFISSQEKAQGLLATTGERTRCHSWLPDGRIVSGEDTSDRRRWCLNEAGQFPRQSDRNRGS